jgi:hypothetical protein
MKSKLLLTLWLVGAVLYAGSTVFLAHAVLGGLGRNHAPDKLKADAVAAADGQCQKASVASHGAEPDKTAAAEPKKPASTLPAKPAPAQNSSKSGTPEAAKRDGFEPRLAAVPDGGSSEKNAADLNASEPSDDQEAAAPDGMPSHEAWQGQEPPLPGAGQEGPEVDEWASVVAGTANMRADPSLQSPMIYALPAGWQVRVISRQPGWVQVQDANSGADGWVEATALAPSAGPGGPGGRPGYDPYGQRYDPYRYADDRYAYGEPPPPWRRSPGGQFADFLRRALGGF